MSIMRRMVPASKPANENTIPCERLRAAPMPTCARDLGWKRLDVIVTMDSPKNKESSSTDTPNLHTAPRSSGCYRPVPLPCPARRTEWRTAMGPLNGAGLCLFRQSITPRFVIAVIMQPRVIVDSMVIGEKKEVEEN